MGWQSLHDILVVLVHAKYFILVVLFCRHHHKCLSIWIICFGWVPICTKLYRSRTFFTVCILMCLWLSRLDHFGIQDG